jgi:methionine-rich copper-binding protein CopC
MKTFLALTITLISSLSVAHANLLVTVNEPKTTGGKVVIKLEMKNTFKEKIESARAVVFLFDDQGKVVGQMTRWVVGGTKDKPALAPDAKTTFNFVVPTDKPFTKTKVAFNRIILEGGKSVDVSKSVEFQQ